MGYDLQDSVLTRDAADPGSIPAKVFGYKVVGQSQTLLICVIQQFLIVERKILDPSHAIYVCKAQVQGKGQKKLEQS